MTTRQTPTIVTARASHSLTTPRKANLILASLPGKKAEVALAQLEMLPHHAARLVIKVLKQAIGNAVSIHQSNPATLTIDTAFATKGRTLKRAHFGGRGHVKPYERTASHITINLRLPRVVTPSAKPKAIAEAASAPKKEVAPKSVKPVKKTTKTK